MSILKYRIFKEVTTHMSFTKAAVELNLTQSAISHAILSLETEIGFSLFKRISNKIVLTTEGLSILEKIDRIILAEDQLQAQIGSIKGLEQGLIRIGSFSSASTRLLPPIIGLFEKNYPNIALSIHEGSYSEIQSWLASGQIDVGFLVDAYLNENHHTVPFFRDEMIAVLPKGLGYDHQDAFDIQDISLHPFIMPTNACNNYLNRILMAYGVTPHIKYAIELNSTIFAMIEQGLGITMVPESTLFRSKYQLCMLPLRQSEFRQIHLCSNTIPDKSPAIKAFIETAVQVKIV